MSCDSLSGPSDAGCSSGPESLAGGEVSPSSLSASKMISLGRVVVVSQLPSSVFCTIVVSVLVSSCDSPEDAQGLHRSASTSKDMGDAMSVDR